MTQKKILEEDLYEPLRDFLLQQGYTVRSEVKHCDISAVKDETLIVVEQKLHLSIDLLLQAANRQKVADSVYIAIPKPKKMMKSTRWKDIYHLLRRLELGLLLVDIKEDAAFVEIALHPVPFDRVKSRQNYDKKRKALLTEFEGRHEDLNKGGSSGKKLVTAYREMSIYIAVCFDKLGSLSPKKLRAIGTDSKKTTSILQKNYYGWFEQTQNGDYTLSESGKQQFSLYSDLTTYYHQKVSLFMQNNML